MPYIGSHRDVASRRWPKHPKLVACIAIAAAALGIATFPTSTPGDAAGAATAPHSRPWTPVKVAAPSDHRVPAGAPAAAQAVALASAAPSGTASKPRAAAHTPSMDVPIQGGLTAHQEQALSSKLMSAHQTPAAAPRGQAWTPAMGLTAAQRAESWLGMPYSWAGGNASGPTLGQCEPGTGGDLDCQIVGFDCSGLAMYAWGAYASLPHLAAAQQTAGGFHPSVRQLLPGDLVFFSGYLSGGTGHVAVYVGKGMVVEAPQSGSVVRRSALADLIAHDGYRGAVRPLTAQPATPTLTAPRTSVPLAGGTVTLRGTHLAGVTLVHVGGVTVQQFVRHTDSAIVFRAPAHRTGTVAVTVSTSWAATSRPVNLTYAQPRNASPVSTPKPSGPSAKPVAPAPPTTTKPGTPPAPVTTPPAPVKSTPPVSGPSSGTPGSGSTTSPPTVPPVSTSTGGSLHSASTSSLPVA